MEKADALGLSTAAILLDLLFGAVPAFDQICRAASAARSGAALHSAGTAALRRRMPLSDRPQAIGLVFPSKRKRLIRQGKSDERELASFPAAAGIVC